jgi:hypothetical protein
MIRPGYLLAWTLLLFCAVAQAADWTVISYDGRDHVTMRNVADFYGLEDYQKVGNSLLLCGRGRCMV